MNKKNNKTYSGDHVLIMFEEIKDQFTAFGEGQQILSDKVDGLEGKFDTMQNDITEIRGDITTIQSDITNIQDDVTEIKHKLSEKVDLADFQKLEKRLIKLERLVLTTR